MELLIKLTPSFNIWVSTEEEFIRDFEDIMRNEMGKGDVDAEIHSVELLTKDNECDATEADIY